MARGYWPVCGAAGPNRLDLRASPRLLYPRRLAVLGPGPLAVSNGLFRPAWKAIQGNGEAERTGTDGGALPHHPLRASVRGVAMPFRRAPELGAHRLKPIHGNRPRRMTSFPGTSCPWPPSASCNPGTGGGRPGLAATEQGARWPTVHQGLAGVRPARKTSGNPFHGRPRVFGLHRGGAGRRPMGSCSGDRCREPSRAVVAPRPPNRMRTPRPEGYALPTTSMGA